MEIKECAIVEELYLCVYCGEEVDDYSMCCGEFHNELHYITKDGEALVASEVEVIRDHLK